MTLRFPRAKFLRWDQASRKAQNGEEEQEMDARDARPTDRLRDEDVVWDMWSAVSALAPTEVHTKLRAAPPDEHARHDRAVSADQEAVFHRVFSAVSLPMLSPREQRLTGASAKRSAS